MFPLIFMLFLFLDADGTLTSYSLNNTSPATVEECKAAIPVLTESMKQSHPNAQIFAWCLEADWPFPPSDPMKGSI